MLVPLVAQAVDSAAVVEVGVEEGAAAAAAEEEEDDDEVVEVPAEYPELPTMASL